jgi:hypothetical protein
MTALAQKFHQEQRTQMLTFVHHMLPREGVYDESFLRQHLRIHSNLLALDV